MDAVSDRSGPRRTVVFFHAHPDDEVLLTGGTMARLAAEGHRVVLVTATAGERGLAAVAAHGAAGLGATRTAELGEAARLLGCSRSVLLGFADSGSTPAATASNAFARMDVQVAAEQLAHILLRERADALTVYDPAGGYGHPDHVQVHRVGVRAAELAGTGLVLEATVDRQLLQRALRFGRVLVPQRSDFAAGRFAHLYTDRAALTHQVDVRCYADTKRAAMAAHSSQSTSDDGQRRGLDWMVRLPRPVFRLVFGREWFVERGRPPGSSLLDDPLASLGE